MTDIVEKLNDSLSAGYSELRKEAAAEIVRLRAKITEMEKQEPVGWIYTVNGGWDCYSPMKPTKDAYDTGSLMPRYALPGARSQPAPSVREGWKLVPIEPTEDMLRAMTDPFVAINGDNRKAFEIAYTAMLAAAPKPEATP